jgi:hypothetical protein
MITCKLYGGLGNQMFQIAATIGLSDINGCDFGIPRDTIDNSHWRPHQFQRLPVFDPAQHDISKYYVFKETSHTLCPLPVGENIILDGYFQSYKYFDSVLGKVRYYFDTPCDTGDNGILAIHCRFGDYRMYPDKHPILPKEYYDKCLRILTEDFHVNQICVFSDEPETAKEYFPYLPETSFIRSENPIDDIYRMCTAQYMIIANSSFSLMACILNQHRNKVVFSPHESQYFGHGNSHLGTSNMIPKFCIQIKH